MVQNYAGRNKIVCIKRKIIKIKTKILFVSQFDNTLSYMKLFDLNIKF